MVNVFSILTSLVLVLCLFFSISVLILVMRKITICLLARLLVVVGLSHDYVNIYGKYCFTGYATVMPSKISYNVMVVSISSEKGKYISESNSSNILVQGVSTRYDTLWSPKWPTKIDLKFKKKSSSTFKRFGHLTFIHIFSKK